MSLVDITIKNAKIATTQGIFDAGLAIEKGKIVAIARDCNLPEANRVIDAMGNIVMPGIVDAHVHIQCSQESFETGTRAAARSGITTVLEMPNSDPEPPASTVQAFNWKRKKGEQNAVVDFGLYGGAGTENIDLIPALANAGAIGFKTFTLKNWKTEMAKGITVFDDGSLTDVLETVEKTGLLPCIHAENDEITDYLKARLEKNGRKDLMAHIEAKPRIAETEAVRRVINLARDSQTRLHLCHVSTKDSINAIRAAKAAGQRVTADICINHLFLSLDYVERNKEKLGPYAKVTPPPRPKEDLEEAWKALGDGTIDFIESDHIAYPRELKEIGWKDIWKAESGHAGIECLLPLLLTKVNQGALSLESLIELTSATPSKIFNLYPQKGMISIGSDADLVVVDMKREWTLNAENMLTAGRALLFDGWKVTGFPILTMVRGEVIMEDGQVVAKPGHGRFLRPRPPP